MANNNQSQVGDCREYLGIQFRATQPLKTFDGRRRGVVWEAGAIAFRVEEAWSDTTGHRFMTIGIHCRTFEKAAHRAIMGMASKARRARDLLAIYDSPDLAAQRAIVDRIA